MKHHRSKHFNSMIIIFAFIIIIISTLVLDLKEPVESIIIDVNISEDKKVEPIITVPVVKAQPINLKLSLPNIKGIEGRSLSLHLNPEYNGIHTLSYSQNSSDGYINNGIFNWPAPTPGINILNFSVTDGDLIATDTIIIEIIAKEEMDLGVMISKNLWTIRSEVKIRR